MQAIFINHCPKQIKSTPSQVIGAFFNAQTITALEGKLLQVYRLAVLGGLVENGAPVSAEEVASLFDQLIRLLRAVESQQQNRSGARYLKLRMLNHRRRSRA